MAASINPTSGAQLGFEIFMSASPPTEMAPGKGTFQEGPGHVFEPKTAPGRFERSWLKLAKVGQLW